jgi:cell wall-associated NlpC family hydrolase
MGIRDDIIRETRTWIGTRWQHQGRVKQNDQFHGGVDCLGLILEVGNVLNLFPDKLIYHNYNRLPHDNLLLQECDRYSIKKSLTNLLPGDILAFRISSEPQHLAILTDNNSIIHAYIQAKKVVENHLDDAWRSKLAAAYCYPGVIDVD